MKISEMSLEELKAYKALLMQHLEIVAAEMRARIKTESKIKSKI